MFVFSEGAAVEALRQAIQDQGKAVGSDILKVDSFLNHRIDTALLFDMGREMAARFRSEKPDLVLTVEASGIALACAAAHHLGDIPVVFCKKSPARNQAPNMAQAEVYSFTHKACFTIRVDLSYIPSGSRVLIVDDFLADGQAVAGMRSLIAQAGGVLVGVGIGIEKGFQPGGRQLRAEGVKLVSLAVVDALDDGVIRCRDC